jgi:hypothetical protein
MIRQALAPSTRALTLLRAGYVTEPHIDPRKHLTVSKQYSPLYDDLTGHVPMVARHNQSTAPALHLPAIKAALAQRWPALKDLCD